MANVYVRSGAAGAGTGADWTNAYTTLAAALTAKAAGDDFWVSEDHAEAAGGAVTLTAPGTAGSPNRIICVNHAGTVPPVSADLATTASIIAGGANNLVVNGHFYMYGLALVAGNGASASGLILVNATNNCQIFESCLLTCASSSSAVGIFFTRPNTTTKYINCTFKFGNIAQSFFVGGFATFEGGSIDGAGSLPTTLMTPNGAQSSILRFENFDASALSGKTFLGAFGANGPIYAQFKRCKLPASFTPIATPTGGFNTANIDFIQCDSGTVTARNDHHVTSGSQTTSTTVIRTSGASDGTTTYAQKITTNTNARLYAPYTGAPLVKWNATTGSNISVVVEGIADPRDFSALPTNAEVWFEAEYLGTAGNPLGVFKRGGVADPLASGSALTASTQAWDTGATARANTTAYTAGDIRKVATNTGRLFICTTSGTSAGSEPAGYASAVDGDSITDNTAVFKAMWRFKQTVTTTAAPQFAGYVYVTPKVAKASLNGVYIDPQVN